MSAASRDKRHADRAVDKYVLSVSDWVAEI